MILEYTAQRLKGFNTLEQGAGELNIEGAVRLPVRSGKTCRPHAAGRTDVESTTLPAHYSTIAGTRFQWSGGMLPNYAASDRDFADNEISADIR